MAIEFFTQSGRGFRPRASIRKQGQIGLNLGAVRRFGIDSWQYAVLGYDRESGRVALKFMNESDSDGVQRVVVKNGSATIAARSFLEFFAIPYRETTQQFDVWSDAETGFLMFDAARPAHTEPEQDREA